MYIYIYIAKIKKAIRKKWEWLDDGHHCGDGSEPLNIVSVPPRIRWRVSHSRRVLIANVCDAGWWGCWLTLIWNCSWKWFHLQMLATCKRVESCLLLHPVTGNSVKQSMWRDRKAPRKDFRKMHVPSCDQDKYQECTVCRNVSAHLSGLMIAVQPQPMSAVGALCVDHVRRWAKNVKLEYFDMCWFVLCKLFFPHSFLPFAWKQRYPNDASKRSAFRMETFRVTAVCLGEDGGAKEQRCTAQVSQQQYEQKILSKENTTHIELT